MTTSTSTQRPARGGGCVVLGHAGRDLVLGVGDLPAGGGAAPVEARVERLGGKGANQAVGLVQLAGPATPVSLIAALGEDAAGDLASRDAEHTGIDVSGVRRGGTTALFVDIVERDGTRRLFEDVPEESLLTREDVDAHTALIEGADTVLLQLQQPDEPLLAAATIARESGARVILDGATDGGAATRLLAMADVVRADAREAQMLTGVAIASREDAETAAEGLLERGPSAAVLEVPGEGDLAAWSEGWLFLPYDDDHPIVDRTGAGDAWVAGLATGLRRGWDVPDAARLGHAAASSTVGRLGGRPSLEHLAPAHA